MATDFFKIGQATGQQFTDVSGAVQKGLEAGLKPFAEYEKSRKERVEALGRILQTTPNLDELPKIPAQYSPKISEWASNAKNEYADAARTLVQTSADSAEYREAVQKMNNIKTAFANLDNQLNGIREERIEYLDDYQNGMVSKGFKNSDIEAAYGANGAIAEIDANGNVSMTGNEGKAFIWSERQEHYNVNPYMQKSMVGLSDNAKENGLKGISFTQDEYKERLKAIMSNPETGNIRALKSLVYDDLDGINALNIAQTNPEILALLEAETPDLPAIKQKLVDILAPALADVNQRGISKYNDALRDSQGGARLTISEQKRLQISDLYNKSLPQIRPTLTSFLNSNKTAQDAINNFSKLGLNVTDQVEDSEGNVIAITVRHSLVDEPTQISLTDPVAAEVGLSNALGYSILGGVYMPQTTTESEQTSTNSTVSATEKIPGTLEEGQYPENFANLDTTERLRSSIDTTEMFTKIQSMVVDAGVPSGRKRDFASRVQKELKDFYGNNYSEANINKAIFDVIGRKNYNEKLKTDFEKGAEEQTSLEAIQKASTAQLTRAQLGAYSTAERRKILKAVNKTQAIDLTEQDILIAAYIQETGDTIENINTRLASSDLPTTLPNN